jgi:hypothetical protein
LAATLFPAPRKAITGPKRREYGEGRGVLYIYASHYRLLMAWLQLLAARSVDLLLIY